MGKYFCRWTCIPIIFVLLIINSSPRVITITSSQFAYTELPLVRGLDLSSLPQVIENGGVFYRNDTQVNILDELAKLNFNMVRVRLWVDPIDGIYDLNYTVDLVRRAHEFGYDFLLDYHFSDSWADPGQQSKPVAWENLDFNDLVNQVYNYTKLTMSSFVEEGLIPTIVQIGNEITCGMLWDDGKVCNPTNSEHWDNLALLLNASISAITELEIPNQPKIMLHVDNGADMDLNQWFFDEIIARKVEFDIIGKSFYPWWHGTLAELEENLNDLATRYGKEILVVETAYPFTLDWNDNTHNSIGLPEQLLEGFPATPEGQRDFLLNLTRIVTEIPEELGLGWVYWEPLWISTNMGSARENLAMVDFEGGILPAALIFESEPIIKTTASLTSFDDSTLINSTQEDIYWNTLGIAIFVIFVFIFRKSRSRS